MQIEFFTPNRGNKKEKRVWPWPSLAPPKEAREKAILPGRPYPPSPPSGDLTDAWDMCTIESNRAGENPAGSLTIQMYVVDNKGEIARGPEPPPAGIEVDSPETW